MLYAMTTCTDSKIVFPRPTPYMLQMAQVPVMNDSGAKRQNPTWQMFISSIYVAFSSFSIFNFFEEATSPGAAGFPGGQIDPRQSTELANEESEMLKSRNRVRLNRRTMKVNKHWEMAKQISCQEMSNSRFDDVCASVPLRVCLHSPWLLCRYRKRMKKDRI